MKAIARRNSSFPIRRMFNCVRPRLSVSSSSMWASIAIPIFVAFLLMSTVTVFAFHYPWDQGHDTFTPNDPNDPNNDDHDHNSCGGGPVDLRTGEYLLLQTPHDVTIRGRGPALSLHFTFNGADRFYNGPFGFGWHTPLTAMAVFSSDGQTNYVTIRQASGRRLTFIQDASGRLISPSGSFQNVISNPDGSITVKELNGTIETYDTMGHLTRIADRYGSTLTIQRDSNGRLLSATDVSGRSLLFTVGPNGKIDSCTDPLGRSWAYTYDTNANLISVRDPAGGLTQYTYTPDHLMLSFIDPMGNVVESNQYDSKRRVIRQVFGGIDTIQFSYVSTNKTILINGAGAAQTTEFSPCCGLPLKITDALSNATIFSYNNNRQVVAMTDARGNTSRYEHDVNGNLTAQIDALNATNFYLFDTNLNLPLESRDVLGNRTQFAYDSHGNLLRLTDPTGNMTSFRYDTNGFPLAITNAEGSVTLASYDTYGNISEVRTSDGDDFRYTHDVVGNRTSGLDALNRVTRYDYDALDRLTNVVDAAGNKTVYRYDANGNLTNVVDALRNSTIFYYDGRNRLIGSSDATGNQTLTRYDRAGNIAQITGRNGETVDYTYDLNNRLKRKQIGQTESVLFSYDSVGNLTAVSNADARITYVFDALNRRIQSTTTGPALQRELTLTYGFDAAGQRLLLSTPFGTNFYAYDSRRQMTRFSNSFGNAVTMQYDVAGHRILTARDGVVFTTNRYTVGGHLIGLSHVPSNAPPFVAIDYVYNKIGNRTNAHVLRGVPNTATNLFYAFDGLDRLTLASNPMRAGAAENFTYDAVGNRSATLHLPTTFNALNQLIEDVTFRYSYDASGRLLAKTNKLTSAWSIYRHDAEGKLLRVDTSEGLIVTFKYDGLARRIEKTVVNANGLTKSTRYVNDNEDILFQFVGSSNTLQNIYLQGPGVDDPLAVLVGNETNGSFQVNKTLYPLQDALGSVLDFVDASGNILNSRIYGAFGEVVNETGTNAFEIPYAYAGREFDVETGLLYCRSRYYDALAGRFLSPDPLGLAAGINLYAYVNNNPVLLYDSYGLDPYLPNPNQKPPGWTPDWPGGTDNRGDYSQNPNTGEKWYPHPEDNGHWPHYDSGDKQGKRYPPDSLKPRPGQKKPKPGQSDTDPWPNPTPEPQACPAPTPGPQSEPGQQNEHHFSWPDFNLPPPQSIPKPPPWWPLIFLLPWPGNPIYLGA